MDSVIEDVRLRKIIDSRGNPTVEADILTWNGFGRAAAPSGASTGINEVVSFPEGGVNQVIEEVEDLISSEIIGMEAEDLREIDTVLKEIDGTDNFPAKFLINDACVMAKKPFSHAGIIRFQGQLMTYVPDKSPCYRCVFKEPPPKDAVPTCKQAGVIGAMGGVIGSLQAMEAVKYILGVGELLTGYLLTYDALKMQFRKVKLPSDTHKCAVCGDNPTITELIDYEQAECDGVGL